MNTMAFRGLSAFRAAWRGDEVSFEQAVEAKRLRPKSLQERSAALEGAVTETRLQGYTLAVRAETSAQLIKGKKGLYLYVDELGKVRRSKQKIKAQGSALFRVCAGFSIHQTS
jgi:hypothetical protein